ncbi:DUF4382 domain-containing protein [Lutibacter sp.]|uniref:DUF4382 domain-containing protein n=1 Tax=Lutibacter sp. TaxID=1925666 RepID=UPI003563CD09
MKFKKIYFVAIAAIVVMLGAQGCANDNESNTASVQLKLVDAPGDYSEVNVEIVDIQYNNSDNESGWVSFGTPEDYPINVDLTTLIAGNSLLLTDQIIPSGMLKQIRLVLGDGNTLKIEGQAEMMALSTPSAMQSGLKLNMNTTLEPGFSYTFILDWDVQNSIVMTGAGMYNLKPVIRVNAEVNSGSIEGNVSGEFLVDGLSAINNLEKAIVQVYTAGDVFVTNSETNADGDFLIQGLAAGDYKLKIVNQDAYDDYESTLITVETGKVTTFASIVLMIPTI